MWFLLQNAAFMCSNLICVYPSATFMCTDVFFCRKDVSMCTNLIYLYRTLHSGELMWFSSVERLGSGAVVEFTCIHLLHSDVLMWFSSAERLHKGPVIEFTCIDLLHLGVLM